MKIVKKTASVLVAVCVTLLCAAAVYAVGVEDSFAGQGAGFASILYDNTNGLPTSEANAVLQTKNGFLWIGSYSGLIRYDGNSFQRYDSELGISSVVSLFEDSKERLWIGTNDNGIAVYHNNQFKHYGKVEGLKSSSIRSIEEDAEGNILIATTFGMAYVDTKDELHTLDDPQLNNVYICELHAGADGVIYGETLSGAFFSIENKRVTSFYNGADLGFGVVSCITPDTDRPGYVYLGTENSDIFYGDMKSGMKDYIKLSTVPHDNINAIRPVKGKVWICADNGIGFFDENKNYVPLNDVPMKNSIDDVTVDYEGNLWFASTRQGVMKIVPCQFTDISAIAGLPAQVINSTLKHDGDLYLGTDTGLVILDENYKVKTTPLSEMLQNSRIRTIKEDSKGNLWFSTFSSNGLVCYKNDGTITSYTESTGFVSNRARTTVELSDGTIAASVSGGVHLMKDGVITGTIDEKNGLSNTEILTICEGEKGELYLGSDGDGLYILNGNNVVRKGLEDGLASEVILRIKKDTKRGYYWIITSNSIAYMNNGEIKTLKNFPYSNNFDIFFDANGAAWILSSNGIYVSNVDSMIEDKGENYIFYDTKCGLPSVATANSRSYFESNGDLYIAGTTGVSYININKAHENEDNIRLAVPYVEADDKIISADKNGDIIVPSNCKRLTIHAYAITYSLTNPRLSYRLDKFDDEAQEILKQDLTPVTYTNLGGGTYTFKLAALDTLSGKPTNEINVKIIKKKALHESIIFWVIIFICTVLAMLLLVRFYINKKTSILMQREKEKEEYIDEMIGAFAMCIDLKDTYTNGHSFRVAEYSKLLAEKLGYSEDKVKEIHKIALLHDIGKLGIPDEVLNKPGRPTDEEYEILKTHPAKGKEILEKITIAPNLAIGAGFHHERLDGRGYPNGLKGDEIPYIAQIIAVADTFDAMYSTRPYRKQMDIEDVKAEMKRVSGTQLNGEIVDKLAELIDEGTIGKRKL